VALPGGQIGLKFVLHSDTPLATCCNIYPHDANFSSSVTSEAGSRFAEVLLENPRCCASASVPPVKFRLRLDVSCAADA